MKVAASPKPPLSVTRILAIDPALRSTGYAILEGTSQKLSCLQHGLIQNHRNLSFSACLVALHHHTTELLGKWNPEVLAIEGVIYVQSHRTAITLGAARGSVILAATQKGLSVYEYAPRRVKQAVVGRGAASKNQVGFMVRALLGLTETPKPDAADAIAIGIAHFHALHDTQTRRIPMPSL